MILPWWVNLLALAVAGAGGWHAHTIWDKAEERDRLEAADLAPFRLPLEAWLDSHQAEAVLVRPDHHVFGTGSREALEAGWQALLAA